MLPRAERPNGADCLINADARRLRTSGDELPQENGPRPRAGLRESLQMEDMETARQTAVRRLAGGRRRSEARSLADAAVVGAPFLSQAGHRARRSRRNVPATERGDSFWPADASHASVPVPVTLPRTLGTPRHDGVAIKTLPAQSRYSAQAPPCLTPTRPRPSGHLSGHRQ